jgi:S-adenosylmethionine synthetase
MTNFEQIPRTAEHVSEGHPDKFCDQVADRILDKALEIAGDDKERRYVRTAIECLAKDRLLIVSGEVGFSEKIRAEIDIHELAREVWERVGYGQRDELTIINHIRNQSDHIRQGVDIGGAGDQGIMVGYATSELINGKENTQMMPLEWVLARDICFELRKLRVEQTLPWLRSDCKSQVTLNEKGEVTNIIVAAQHAEVAKDLNNPAKKHKELEDMERAIIAHAIQPVLFPDLSSLTLEKKEEEFGEGEGKEVRRHYFIKGVLETDIRVVVNGTGEFAIGGTIGDAGVVGRKIVVDAYGPQVPVGGGAYSGKDPTKVDRSAAYMARYIAKMIIAKGVKDSNQCIVKLAYGIGQHQPAMVSAITDKGDVSGYVKEKLPDLSPEFIINSLKLRRPTAPSSGEAGWSYIDTAAYGHYGRKQFPWEQID